MEDALKTDREISKKLNKRLVEMRK